MQPQENFSPIMVRNDKTAGPRPIASTNDSNNAPSSPMLADHQIPTPIIFRHLSCSHQSPPEVSSDIATSTTTPRRPELNDDDASMEPLPFSAAAVAAAVPHDPTQPLATKKSPSSSVSQVNANATLALKSNSPTTNGPQGKASITTTTPPLNTKAPTTTTTSKDDVVGTAASSKEDSLDCPHPKDILFPIFGYQLWAGNVRFIRLIKSKRADFDNAASRSIQATMTIKIMEAVEKDGGRFLSAVETPDNDHAMIVCTTRWRRLNKRETLTQIIKFLKRQDAESLQEAKRARRDARRKTKMECRRTKHEALITPQVIPSEDETEALKKEPKAPIDGTLMALYYVPPFVGGQNDSDDDDDEDDAEESASEETTSDEDSRPTRRPLIRRHPPKKKSPPKKKKKAATAAATSADGARKIGGFGKPKSGRSLKAAEGEGVIDLPKGVTVRPSGKWQAQTYFAGQSRYVGVYDTSLLAAKAYNVVQDFLADYRAKNKIERNTPREELAAIFGQARIAAEQAVMGMTPGYTAKDPPTSTLSTTPLY